MSPGRRDRPPGQALSTFLAGVFLLILVVGFGDVVAIIPARISRMKAGAT